MSCRRWHVRGRASMAAVCWYWFFCRQGFTPPASVIAVAPSGLLLAAMSCRRWHVRGRASMAAVCWYWFFLSAGVYTACLRNCCRPFGAVFSGHVMPTLACAWAGIYGCGMLVLFFCRQGFTPPASAIAAAPSGLCSAAMSCRRWHVRGRASMAAVCWYCFALFPANNTISPTKTLWRQTYFTVLHWFLCLFISLLNNIIIMYI